MRPDREALCSSLKDFEAPREGDLLGDRDLGLTVWSFDASARTASGKTAIWIGVLLSSACEATWKVCVTLKHTPMHTCQRHVYVCICIHIGSMYTNLHEMPTMSQ